MSKKFQFGLFLATTLVSTFTGVAQATPSLQSNWDSNVNINNQIVYTAGWANSAATEFAAGSNTTFANGDIKDSWLSASASPSRNSLSAEDSKSSDDQVKSRHNNLVTAVPEPETYAMLLAGLGLFVFMARRNISK